MLNIVEWAFSVAFTILGVALALIVAAIGIVTILFVVGGLLYVAWSMGTNREGPEGPSR